MCYSQSELQVYLDSEATQKKRWEIEVHLEGCKECQNSLAELKEQNQLASSVLESYNCVIENLNPKTTDAWQRFAEQNKKAGRRHSFKGVGQFMQRYRRIAVVLPVLALLATLLSFSTVRSSLADLLHIFRVEKVETVNLSPQDLARLRQAMKNGSEPIDIKNFGKVAVEGNEEQKVVSFEEAQKAVDFALKIPDAPVEGFDSVTYKMQSPMKISLTLDVEKVNEVITSLGSDKLLPKNIDGKTFTLEIPTTITAIYPAATEGARPLTVSQARSPEIVVPAGVDVDEIRDSLLSLEILPQDFRKKLAAADDWQHTLLVPNIEGSTKKVSINGVDGVFISPLEQAASPEKSGVLLWPRDGVITVIAGAPSLDEALAVAALLK